MITSGILRLWLSNCSDFGFEGGFPSRSPDKAASTGSWSWFFQSVRLCSQCWLLEDWRCASGSVVNIGECLLSMKAYIFPSMLWLYCFDPFCWSPFPPLRYGVHECRRFARTLSTDVTEFHRTVPGRHQYTDISGIVLSLISCYLELSTKASKTDPQVDVVLARSWSCQNWRWKPEES